MRAAWPTWNFGSKPLPDAPIERIHQRAFTGLGIPQFHQPHRRQLFFAGIA